MGGECPPQRVTKQITHTHMRTPAAAGSEHPCLIFAHRQRTEKLDFASTQNNRDWPERKTLGAYRCVAAPVPQTHACALLVAGSRHRHRAKAWNVALPLSCAAPTVPLLSSLSHHRRPSKCWPCSFPSLRSFSLFWVFTGSLCYLC